MKRTAVALFIASLFIMSGCNNNSNSTSISNTNVESVTITDSNVEKKYRGSSSLTWHTNETFVALVDVTILGDKITKVEIVDGSYITTGKDAFKLWDEEEFLKRFIGKTIAEINELEANDPKDPTNHFDGGSLNGEVEAIAGATASSTVVAKAVKEAVLKAAVKDAISKN